VPQKHEPKKSKTPPMVLKFVASTGANFNGVENQIPSGVRKIRDYCQTMPAGELADALEVSSRIGMASSTLVRHATHPFLSDCRQIFRRKMWFGNQQTILELKKQSNENHGQ